MGVGWGFGGSKWPDAPTMTLTQTPNPNDKPQLYLYPPAPSRRGTHLMPTRSDHAFALACGGGMRLMARAWLWGGPIGGRVMDQSVGGLLQASRRCYKLPEISQAWGSHRVVTNWGRVHGPPVSQLGLGLGSGPSASGSGGLLTSIVAMMVYATKLVRRKSHLQQAFIRIGIRRCGLGRRSHPRVRRVLRSLSSPSFTSGQV